MTVAERSSPTYKLNLSDEEFKHIQKLLQNENTIKKLYNCIP